MRIKGLSDAEKATRFLEGFKVPEGPNAGKPLRLAPYQRQFVHGALAPETHIGALSIGRGNAKTALCSGLALGALLGVWDPQPRRQIILAARVTAQASIALDYATAFLEQLPHDVRARVKVRHAPRFELEFEGKHVLRAVGSEARSALGLSPNLVLMDERGHWAPGRGDDLESALLSSLGKRGGRALILSTSAADDAHPFSIWMDEEQEGVYRQEHRPSPGLPADDLESLLIANPGAEHGIGSSVEWLQREARRAIQRGGKTLNDFRLYNRNERVSGEARELLLTPDEWLTCESAHPPREGQVVVGLDLGGSASMTAAAFYWPATGRLEAHGWFPSNPSLLDRGQNDAVRDRYVRMHDRGELTTLGEATVPVAAWLREVAARVEGEGVAAVVADRFKQAEVGEGLHAAGVRAPVVWRGMGYRDGNEDCDRFRRAAFDGRVHTTPSLLLRSSFADAAVVRDDAGNIKLTKARSKGKIDTVAAAVLAVAEGARVLARGPRRGGRLVMA